MRFFIFAVIIAGILFVLNAGGVTTPTTGSIMEKFNFNLQHGNETISELKSSSFWTSPVTADVTNWGLRELLIGLVIAGITASFITGGGDVTKILKGVLAFTLLSVLITDLVGLASYFTSSGIEWIKWVGITIFGAMIVGLIITAIDWWQGTD